MKNKKNLLSVLLAAVLLVLCVLGLLMTGASAGELDPNTTLYYINDEGNDDGETVKEGDVPVFQTIRGALAYAKEQTWGADQKLRLEITQDEIASPRSNDYIFSSSAIGIVEREDYTPLPITLTGRDGAKVTVTSTTTSSSTTVYFCNNWYIDNVDITITGAKSSLCYSYDIEFHNVKFTLPSSSTMRSNGFVPAQYHLTAENVAKRVDENGEINVTATYSGNTEVPDTCVLYGSCTYSGEGTSSPGSDWPENLTVGDKTIKRYHFNSKTVIKDNTIVRGTTRARNSTYLGDGIIEIRDNAKTSTVQNVFNRSVINGSVNRVEIFGGTVSSVTVFYQAKEVDKNSKVELIIHGGTITNSVSVKAPAADSEGTYQVIVKDGKIGGTLAANVVPTTIYSGTFGRVTGTDITLAGGTIYSASRDNPIEATKAIGNTTVKQAVTHLHKEGTIAFTIPKEYASFITVDNTEGPRGYMWLVSDDKGNPVTDKEGYEEKIVVERKLSSPSATVLEITDRVVVRILLSTEMVQHARAFANKDFTYYCDALGVLAESPVKKNLDDLLVYDENNYYIELPAVGAAEFSTKFTWFNSLFAPVASSSVEKIATDGAALYAESDPEAAAMFNALLDYGKATVEGTTALDHFDADAVASLAIPAAARPVKGEGAINFTNVTLLMGDTLGIRFKADGATTGATVKFNGAALAADQFAIGENCVDLYVSAVTLLNPIPVEIYDAEGVLCASFGYSVAGIANSIYTADNTNLKAASILNLIAAIENYVA